MACQNCDGSGEVKTEKTLMQSRARANRDGTYSPTVMIPVVVVERTPCPDHTE